MVPTPQDITNIVANSPKAEVSAPQPGHWQIRFNQTAAWIANHFRYLFGICAFGSFFMMAFFIGLKSVLNLVRIPCSFIGIWRYEEHVNYLEELLKAGDGFLIAFSFSFLALRAVQEVSVAKEDNKKDRFHFVDKSMICMVSLTLAFHYLAEVVSGEYNIYEFIIFSFSLFLVFLGLSLFIKFASLNHQENNE